MLRDIKERYKRREVLADNIRTIIDDAEKYRFKREDQLKLLFTTFFSQSVAASTERPEMW